MSSPENAMRLVVKMYEARETFRSLTSPEQYRKAVAIDQTNIRRTMVLHDLPDIQAVIKMAKEARGNLTRLGLFAAFIEMVEAETLSAPGHVNL